MPFAIQTRSPHSLFSAYRYPKVTKLASNGAGGRWKLSLSKRRAVKEILESTFKTHFLSSFWNSKKMRSRGGLCVVGGEKTQNFSSSMSSLEMGKERNFLGVLAYLNCVLVLTG